MQTTADRINERMKLLKMSQADIKRATGAGKATISSWVNGDTTPSGNYASKLAKFLKCRTDWLLTGHGLPEIEGQSEQSMNIRGIDDMDETDLNDDEVEVLYFKKVPVSGGSKELPVYKAADKKIKIKKCLARRAGASITHSFCYDLEGKSMEPKISDKAQCVADNSKTEIKEGKIYCFRHGVMRRTKYLSWLPDGSLLIRSENKEFDDEIVSHDDLNDIKVLGWVYNWNNVDTW